MNVLKIDKVQGQLVYYPLNWAFGRKDRIEPPDITGGFLYT